MKLIYSKPKGQRLKGKGNHMDCLAWLGIEIEAKTNFRYMEKEHMKNGRWIDFTSNYDKSYVSSSNMAHVKSVKEFRRKLKQWAKYLPTGITFKLVSIYRGGYDIIGKI